MKTVNEALEFFEQSEAVGVEAVKCGKALAEFVRKVQGGCVMGRVSVEGDGSRRVLMTQEALRLEDGAALFAGVEPQPQGQALPELPDPVDEVLCYDQHPNGVAGRLITTSLPAADDYFTADQMVARYNNGCVAGYASGFAAGRASQLALPAGPVPEGYHLVPVEPRPECCDEGKDGSDECCGNGACAYLEDVERARASVSAVLASLPPSPAVAQPVADERDELAPCGTPTGKGIYAWIADGGAALVMVNKRPSDHSPGGVLNGHAMDSTRFYDGCPVTEWRTGKWFGPLKSFEPARATLGQPAEEGDKA